MMKNIARTTIAFLCILLLFTGCKPSGEGPGPMTPATDEVSIPEPPPPPPSKWVEMGGSASGGGISDTPDVSQTPVIEIDSDGNPVVAWRDNSNGN